jgi:hypothetical protein
MPESSRLVSCRIPVRSAENDHSALPPEAAKQQLSTNSIKGSLSGGRANAIPSTEAQPGLWAGTKVSEMRQLSIRLLFAAIFSPGVAEAQRS